MMKTFGSTIALMVAHIVDVINTTELCTLKWLKSILLQVFYHNLKKALIRILSL